MLSLGVFIAAVAASLAAATTAAEANPVKQVAIIGAGAAGSSAAYHLSHLSDSETPINITIFEATSRIGGRTLTVNAYDSPLEPVELGASIFVKVNHILYQASRHFNLSTADNDRGPDGLLVVWDGERFVYEQSDTSWRWWSMARLFWKYGMAPYRVQTLMKKTIGTFLNMYEAPYFPFRSLSQRVFELGLEKLTGITGAQLLEENSIAPGFAHDIVQASTRVNYASNLKAIHGLETMVSMAPEGAMQIQGGNWRIFSSMLESCNSTCNLYKDARVTKIARASTEKNDSPHRYTITAKTSETEETHPLSFDSVVIAAPWQFADIEADDKVIQRTIDEIPYTRLHVTLFTSPYHLHEGFFNLPPGTKMPTTVLTTLSDDEEETGAGKPGFYSISTLRIVQNPRTDRVEYLYKIFSPEAVTAEFLTSLLGAHVPDKFVAAAEDVGTTAETISWYHPHVFWSYPKELPRVTFEEIIVGDSVYYTSGIESFISTMETSALMGKNIARLIYNDFVGEEDAGWEKAGPVADDDSARPKGDVFEEL